MNIEVHSVYPKIRFPEFQDEWSKTTLHKVSTNISYGIGASAVEYDGKNKYLRITDINEDSHQFVPKPLSSPEGNDFNNYRLIPGDIAFARTGASVGKSYLYKESDGNLIYAGFLIKFHIQTANPYFIYLLTFRAAYKKWVLVHSMRSGQPGLNAEEYKEFAFLKPSLPEQQKIATFLSAVDKKIQQLQRKKELLEQYKKGVMQKIFSQEIRFKDEDGDNYPDWEEKRLGEVFTITSSKRVFQNEWRTEGIPFYRAREIVKLEKNGFVDNELFITRAMYDKYKESFGVPQEGDLLVTGVGTLGRVHLVKKGEEIYFKDGNIVWFKGIGLVSSKYIRQLFQSRIIKKQIADNASITTVGTFTIIGAKSTRIPLPCKKEQRLIAIMLDSLDVKIKSIESELNSMSTFKKGLLQQMFV
jgi:type I restriction enzyme, S subunit